MSQYESLISPGVIQPLEQMPFHRQADLTRRLMAGALVHADAGLHVAVHEIGGLSPLDRDYCVPHRHTCHELNLLLSFDKLVFRFTLGDESYVVHAPATVSIPPGLLHSANVVEGRGFFIAILPTADYRSTIHPQDLDRVPPGAP